MDSPERRQFLRGIGVAGTIGLGGCQRSFAGENTPTLGSEDTDGDGVVDSEDAAPGDPEVREGEQVNGDSSSADTEISGTPVIRLDEELPDGFTNGGATRERNTITGGASGEYVWEFDGGSHIQTDYAWGETDHSGTLASWVYVSSADATISSPRYLLSARDASAQVGEFDALSLMQAPDAGIGIQKNTDGEDNIAGAFASNYPTDQWFHLTGVVDKDGNEVRVYINGEQRDVAPDLDITMEYGTEFGIGAQAKTVGGGSYQYNSPFTGKLDDVRIYETALTPEAIPRVY